MKNFYFQCQTKSVERLKEGVKIKGFASTPDWDRHDDVVLPEAFTKTLNDYISRKDAPALLRGHNPDYIAGRILMDGDDAPVITDKGLQITGIVTDKQTADEAEAGELRTFSIGYIPIKSDFQMRPTGRFDQQTGQELFREARILKELDLVEVSLVSTPANPNALFTVTKSLTKMFNSLPSPSMKLKCDVCGQEEACGRVGTRFIGKACIDKMQFKSDEVTALPEEKPEEVKEPEIVQVPADEPVADPPSTSETPVETPEQPAPEEGTEKDEQGVTVSPEDKAHISAIAKKFADLDAATVADGDETPADVSVDTKELGAVFASLANVLTSLNTRMKTIEKALATTPVYKGKSIMAFSATKQVVSEEAGKKSVPTDAGFVNMLKSAKHGTRVVIGDDDE